MDEDEQPQTFWGCKVAPGKVTPYVPPPELGSKLHVSTATLQYNTPSGATAHITAKVGDEEAITICALRQGQSESAPLGLVFGSYTEFEVLGKATVHLSGYYLYDEAPPEGPGGMGPFGMLGGAEGDSDEEGLEEGDEEDFDDDDDEEDDEDDEDFVGSGKLSRRDLQDLVKGKGRAAAFHKLANDDSSDEEEEGMEDDEEEDDEFLNGEGLVVKGSGLVIEELDKAPEPGAAGVVVAQTTVLEAGGAAPQEVTAAALAAEGRDALGQKAEGAPAVAAMDVDGAPKGDKPQPKLSRKQKRHARQQAERDLAAAKGAGAGAGAAAKDEVPQLVPLGGAGSAAANGPAVTAPKAAAAQKKPAGGKAAAGKAQPQVASKPGQQKQAQPAGAAASGLAAATAAVAAAAAKAGAGAGTGAGAAPEGGPLDSKSKKKRDRRKRKADGEGAKQPAGKKPATAANVTGGPEAAPAVAAASSAEGKAAEPKTADAAAPAAAAPASKAPTATEAAAPATAASKPLRHRKYPNGFEVLTTRMGAPDGKIAKPGKKAVVRYVGKLKSGKVFDETKGKKTFSFRLGVGEVIKGWDQGVEGMRVGDKVQLTVPPQMAYGSDGVKGAIPPNSTLSFDVELVDVK